MNTCRLVRRPLTRPLRHASAALLTIHEISRRATFAEENHRSECVNSDMSETHVVGTGRIRLARLAERSFPLVEIRGGGVPPRSLLSRWEDSRAHISCHSARERCTGRILWSCVSVSVVVFGLSAVRVKSSPDPPIWGEYFTPITFVFNYLTPHFKYCYQILTLRIVNSWWLWIFSK